MRVRDIIKKIMIGFLAGILVFGTVPVAAIADEVEEAPEDAEEGGEGEESKGEEGEEGLEEGEISAEEAQAALEVVTPSSIATNIDGKFLALTFPASEVPEGFAVKTVDYEGEKVMLAYIVSKSATIGAEGMTVYLAYLTDGNGSNGEFYLCDTTENARMSDLIKIDGANGRYIIVLDPGDNVVGPDGFSQHKLQWGSKTATAWSLPKETVEEEEEEATGEVKDAVKDAFLPTKVFAAELNLNAGEAAAVGIDPTKTRDSGDAAKGSEEDNENAMLALDAIAHTNASGLIQAQPKEFCLLYAIDESGNLGFYLYDIERGTYQRYVDIPKGESKTLTKYRKLSRTRLFIIIVLAIILVILIFVLINMMMKKNDGGEEEGDDEEEAMRKRAKDKERKNIGKRERAYLLEEEEEKDEEEGFEDDYDEDEEEDDEDDEDEDDEEDDEEEEPVKPVKHRSITRKDLVVKSPYSRKENTGDTGFDWKNMEITAGLNPKKTESEINKKKTENYDLDDDFDFEFLNVKK